MMNTCDTSEHFHGAQPIHLDDGVETHHGLCRRYPPVMTMANVKVRKDGGETEFTSNWQFPPMYGFGGCGEHHAKEAR